ncbi:alpha/beta hydrolase family protein [Mesorhizobium sp. ASY16-5R]|uniref:alpha/beta hydrolase family protein n=1 Tax=Mesorhizobium sp. ASY16-5R TaxID=3445772 RepID=UPI003F9EDF54
MPPFLIAGPADAAVTLLLAHGAGAPMDSAWMNSLAEKLTEQGVRTVRFEFGYMAARRQGQRKPPPRGETLMPEYVAAVEALGAAGKLFVGGKSLGGRVASMVADALFHDGKIAGLVCLGYPFHPPGRPDKLRTKHLESLTVPALICQGTRDPFGTWDEVENYPLSPSTELFWLEDGDHDFKPRMPHSLDGHLNDLAARVAKWMAGR